MRKVAWLLCVTSLLQELAAETFAVRNVEDSGPGSLRQAILDANAHSGPDMIAFKIPDPLPGPYVITEFPVPGTPIGLVVSSDGIVWMNFSYFFRSLTRFDPKTSSFQKILFPRVQTFYFQWTAGADATVWSADSEFSQIGRVTSSGELTEFILPGSSSFPNHLTAGPDGNLWFTDFDHDAPWQVGKITPNGIITEFPFPTLDCWALFLIDPNGPEVVVWAAPLSPDSSCAFYGKILRIDLKGRIQEFALSDSRETMNSLAVGPDGNLWFTIPNTNRIGRVTPSGIFAYFSLPDSVKGIDKIIAGPEGQLWFAEIGTHNLGSISVDGSIREFSLPGQRDAKLLTTGPEGTLWFSEAGTSKVSRFTTKAGSLISNKTIHVKSPLPVISDPVTLDGYTQPGSKPNASVAGNDALLLVELSGMNAGLTANGLEVTSDFTVIRGLSITDFDGAGVFLHSDNNIVQGCFIGTRLDGIQAGPNGMGLLIDGISNRVGSIQTEAFASLLTHHQDAGDSNQVAGIQAEARNLISGNRGDGIGISGGTFNSVQGNFIGPDRSGTNGPGNGSNGLKISFGVSSVIGGNIPESGNIIGFNGGAGVFIEAGYGNFVRRNTFLANKGLAIDLGKHGPTPNDPGDNDTGANGLQNFPIILTARPSGTNTVVQGYLDTVFTLALVLIDFYATRESAADGADFFIGSGSPDFYTSPFTITLPVALSPGDSVRAVVIDRINKNTSEFSPAVRVSADNSLIWITLRFSGRFSAYVESVPWGKGVLGMVDGRCWRRIRDGKIRDSHENVSL